MVCKNTVIKGFKKKKTILNLIHAESKSGI